MRASTDNNPSPILSFEGHRFTVPTCSLEDRRQNLVERCNKLGISAPVSFGSLPIVYREEYNFEFPSDVKKGAIVPDKRRQIASRLTQEFSAIATKELPLFHQAAQVSNRDLYSIHSPHYLQSLNDPNTADRIMGLSGFAKQKLEYLEKGLYQPMRMGVGDTLLSVALAFEYGWSANLSGGFHHARYSAGRGMCPYSDIALATLKILNYDPNARVLIVDTDVHQSDGLYTYLKEHSAQFPNTGLLDLFNRDIFPVKGATITETSNYLPVALASWVKDEEYLPILSQALEKAWNKFNPTFVIYVAGHDTHKSDGFGRMKLSTDGIIERDKRVIQRCQISGVPFSILLGGGYGASCVDVATDVARSWIATCREN